MKPQFTRVAGTHVVDTRQTVGVAPGTTTMQIAGTNVKMARAWDPYGTSLVDMGGLRGLREADTKAKIRWDLIALLGGGSLLIALTAGLIANAAR